VFPTADLAKDGATQISPEHPVSEQGTVSFLLHVDKTLKNGSGGQTHMQNLISLPGLCDVFFRRDNLAVNIFFVWPGFNLNRGFHIELPELWGPQKYFFLFTWDMKQGLCNGYLNGIPLRFPGVGFKPWQTGAKATEIKTGTGALKVTEAKAFPYYLPEKKAAEFVPRELLNKGAHLLGLNIKSNPIAINTRRGKILYENNLANSKSIKDWIMEGPGVITFEDGHLLLRSKNPRPQNRGEGHFNFWCPKNFPNHFIAEWEFAPLKEHGLSIIFYAAKGKNGEDIFAKSLPQRNGHYPQYTTGEIINYHIIYFSNLPLYQTGNISTRLRRANMFCDLALGPIAIAPGSKGFQKMRLIKDGEHVQLFSNDRICLDFTDPGAKRWGSVLGSGKIAFRQMAVTEGAYRNFKVWSLHN
jgi:hypothetical protein